MARGAFRVCATQGVARVFANALYLVRRIPDNRCENDGRSVARNVFATLWKSQMWGSHARATITWHRPRPVALPQSGRGDCHIEC